MPGLLAVVLVLVAVARPPQPTGPALLRQMSGQRYCV